MANFTTPMLAGQASVWVQPNGPNTEPLYLGCHEVGDITEDLGDMTRLYCPDPARAGAFKLAGSYAGEPGPPTTSITTHVGKTADWLEKMLCPASIFVHKVSCNRRDLFTNYDRSFIMRGARITSRGLSNLAAREPNNEGRSEMSFDLSMEELLRIFLVTADRQTIAADGDLKDIVFCKDQKCADSCGPAADLCQYGVAVGETLAGSAATFANIYITEDGGATWTAAATDPFGAGEDINAVTCYHISRDVVRILVANGSAGAGPAEVAYSDDDGATWTVVVVGAVNGQFVDQAEGLFSLDMFNTWMVTNGGYVYHSDDGGVTWVTQEAGVITTETLHCVVFIDALNGYVAGENNTIMHSTDGGVSWTLLAGPAGQAAVDIHALEVIDENTVWIGYNDGQLWWTDDAGANWTRRTLVPWTAGTITYIDFVNELVGWLLHDTGGPIGTTFRTIDGGYTWEAVAMPTNTGLNAAYPCDENNVFVVGNVTGLTGFVGKVFA